MRTIAIALFLTGCTAGSTAGSRQVTVDGAGDFCVPRQFLVSAPPWVPENKPGTPRGFAFAGCWHAGAELQPCPFPDTVITGAVHGAGHGNPTFHGSFPPDAFIRSVLRETDTTFKHSASGRVVSAQNIRLWQDWYLWELHKPEEPRDPFAFREHDRLIAACHFGKSVYKPLAVGPQNIFCRRSFEHGSLAIQYSFEASEEFPQNMSSMDSKIIATLKGWQCSKAAGDPNSNSRGG
jgi:hypothetical protein